MHAIILVGNASFPKAIENIVEILKFCRKNNKIWSMPRWSVKHKTFVRSAVTKKYWVSMATSEDYSSSVMACSKREEGSYHKIAFLRPPSSWLNTHSQTHNPAPQVTDRYRHQKHTSSLLTLTACQGAEQLWKDRLCNKPRMHNCETECIVGDNIDRELRRNHVIQHNWSAPRTISIIN